MRAQFGVPRVRVARSLESQITEQWLCLTGTAHGQCAWQSLSQEVLWTCWG